MDETAKTSLYDVLVLGGGPAGVAAAVYSARKKLKTLLITDSFGGQSIVSDDIQNWIGEAHISGLDLSKKFEAHVKSFPEIDVKLETAKSIKTVKDEKSGNRICDFIVSTENGDYRGKTIVLATGARRRKLGIPGEDKFIGKGIAYCSTCDAPLFKDKKVAVVGGGNAGLEAVQDLLNYAQEVYLMEYGEALKGDPATAEEIMKNPKLKEVIFNAQTAEVLGDGLVSGIKFRDTKTGQEKTLEVGGIFVEIGSVPNSEIVKDLVQLDEHNQVIINFQYARTSHPGIFAAGDVTNDPYKQNNISVGDGVRAALSAYDYLLSREKTSPAAEKHELSSNTGS